jgi:hypothetical protein
MASGDTINRRLWGWINVHRIQIEPKTACPIYCLAKWMAWIPSSLVRVYLQ